MPIDPLVVMSKKLQSGHLARALLLTCALAGPACAAAAVGGAAAGGVAYANGKLDSKAPEPVPVVQQATLLALADLGLPVLDQRGDAGSGRVESQYSDGQSVRVDLTKKGSSVTEISIRVGTFGDQARSAQLLSAINQRLPSRAGQAGAQPAIPRF
jgi:hypothetical protein